ncbi:putative dehydrogenase [Microbacterium ginsengiterrae]|uniref:Putative dehydrogenase n=1 Tax=Microbacterium ginsengiterrae TaxID=546115 RepID=A0A7W9FB13_9MICO|nr:Gfo/Idh/MocA family oxidoreductase [Microbacterium ginsengiterrae]MBB5742811.1 putative dehydrogenase [Microbacterium ginsengiterrae]
MTTAGGAHDRFRLGLVGHGRWASTYFLPGSRWVSDVDVVAVCGRDAGRASVFAQEHGIPSAYGSIERMLEAERLDGVIIASPPHEHEAAVRAVARHRVAVLCEKPLALDGDGARRIRDLLSDRPGMTGFTLRWHPLFRTLVRAVRGGEVGRVRHVRIRYLQSSGATTARPWGWHFDAATEPLGVVSDLGPHAIDLVRWIVGDVREVTAFARTTIPFRADAEGGAARAVTNIDDADVQVTAASGVTASLTLSRVAPDTGAPGSITVEVHGETGWIRASSVDEDVLIGDASGTRRRPVPVTSILDGAGDEIRDFVDSARGAPPAESPTIEDGLRAQLVIEAIARSLEAGAASVVS